MKNDLFLGIDLGTTGARAIAMQPDGAVAGEARSALEDHGQNHRAPDVWWATVVSAVSQVLAQVDPGQIRSICVDGTSGSMLAMDSLGQPLSDGRMYNDACDDPAILEAISRAAPRESAAHGATSGAAKALILQAAHPDCAAILHQADWITGRLCGVYASDDNNALKTGYDSVHACWPTWMDAAGIDRDLLPEVFEPGTAIGPVLPQIAREFGLSDDVQLISGTTDGCAAFLATGAAEPGDGVTSIGTTLILKIISDTPIFDPDSGIYSHRLLGNWLAGGASNTGGGVLMDHFSLNEIEDLSRKIDPESHLGLDYYPLSTPGERFPIADPQLAPRLEPRPESQSEFLKALFEGIAGVEALGYAKLHALGAPKCTSVRTVGGAARNDVMTRIRGRILDTPITSPAHVEAAYGAAILARRGMVAG